MKAEEKLIETAASAPAAEEEPYPPAGYAWYVVGALTFVYMFSFIDRQILNLLVAPIRRDLGITDTQMSWLMGPAFAFSYILFGIVFGDLPFRRQLRRPWDRAIGGRHLHRLCLSRRRVGQVLAADRRHSRASDLRRVAVDRPQPIPAQSGLPEGVD